MFHIVLGVFTSLLTSTGDSFRKLAIDESKMSNALFKLTATIFSLIVIVSLLLFFGITPGFLTNPIIVISVFCIVFAATLNGMLCVSIFKKEKLSTLLPYDSLDKIFIILIGFILYYGTNNETSIITLSITFITILIVFFGTVDVKKLAVPKTIKLFVLYKFIKAIIVLSTGYILLEYSGIDFVIVEGFFSLFIATLIVFGLKQNPKEIFQQSKRFYQNRILASIFFWSGYIIGLYIIQTSGVIIATLLGFFSIAFNVLSMKYIVKDNPTKKQILLAVTVLVMIGFGYYFK